MKTLDPFQSNFNKHQYNLSINLGGGGARGLAHIGVLKALKEENIHYNLIIGVSMGSVVGGMFSFYKDTDIILQKIKDIFYTKEFENSFLRRHFMYSADKKNSNYWKKIYNATEVIRRIHSQPGIITEDEIQKQIQFLVPNINIEDSYINFATNAVCLETKKLEVFHAGSMQSAIAASSALPPVYPPHKLGAYHYTDGAMLDKCGILTAKKLGVKKIISIDVTNQNEKKSIKDKNSLDILLSATNIMSDFITNQQNLDADITIHPIIGKINWFDFHKLDDMVQMGYESIRKNIEEIRDITKQKQSFRKVFSFPFFKKT